MIRTSVNFFTFPHYFYGTESCRLSVSTRYFFNHSQSFLKQIISIKKIKGAGFETNQMNVIQKLLQLVQL